MSQQLGIAQALLLVARCLLVAIALAFSLLSIGLFMAGVGENNIPLVRQMWLLYFFSALVIGLCLPRWWYSAVGVAWLPLLLLPGFLWGFVTGDRAPQNDANRLAALLFVLSPLVALAGGYLGGKIVGVYLSRVHD